HFEHAASPRICSIAGHYGRDQPNTVHKCERAESGTEYHCESSCCYEPNHAFNLRSQAPVGIDCRGDATHRMPGLFRQISTAQRGEQIEGPASSEKLDAENQGDICQHRFQLQGCAHTHAYKIFLCAASST